MSAGSFAVWPAAGLRQQETVLDCLDNNSRAPLSVQVSQTLNSQSMLASKRQRGEKKEKSRIHQQHMRTGDWTVGGDCSHANAMQFPIFSWGRP